MDSGSQSETYLFSYIREVLVRTYGLGSQKTSFILSPTAKIFRCRRLALKHMIEQGMGEEEVTVINIHPSSRSTWLFPRLR